MPLPRLRAVLTAGRLAGRRLLSRPESERDAALGELLAAQLDDMKGLAMKLGQIASYLDVPLPPSAQQKLARLQTGLTGLPRGEARAVLLRAWGPDFEARFEAFDWEPVAAASIGQVHRARVDGTEVAVKLRYPQVAAGFESDLNAVRRVAGVAALVSSVEGRRIVDELAARLADECDYRREAADQMRFRHAFEPDPEVIVPEVLPSFTTESTLVTHWAPGSSLEATRRRSPSERDAYGTTLVRFSYTSLLRLAAIQADPHPGNFLFAEPGRVAFLDFGCVRGFELDFVEHLRAIPIAVDRRDRPAFRAAVVGLGIAPNPQRFDFEHFFDMMAHLHRPLLQERFEFTPQYVQQGLAYNGPTSPNARTMSIPPAYVWVARLQWGLWSSLNRLGVRRGFRPVFDEIIAAPIQPLPLTVEAAAGADSVQ
ncbi:MAG: AarF/ABC1/UbiB kinase family protein [Myxococcales bacterium FL481]|nr:MAG: AarF/ABC1/UbiB kinase family protein [Myxococcales bacterium FL481]